MNRLLFLGKRAISLLLICSILLSLCSCAFFNKAKDKVEDIANQAGNTATQLLSKAGELLASAEATVAKTYGTAKDSVIYVYDEAASLTATGYEKASALANGIIGDVSEYIEGLNRHEDPMPDVYAHGNPDMLIKDFPDGMSYNDSESITIDDKYITEQFITYYVSSILDARGYDVYNGVVYYKGEIYGGIIFTKGDVFIEENGHKISSCGFIQIVSDDYTGFTITDEIVQSGLIAVSSASFGASTESFIVEDYALLEDFSGIYHNIYFSLKQYDHYVLRVSMKENLAANYDSTIDLYDFDNEKYLYQSDGTVKTDLLYIEENEVFQSAATTVNAIVDYGENTVDSLATVFVMDGNVLDSLMSKVDEGIETVTGFIQNAVEGITLSNEQFLEIDSSGEAHILGIKNEDDEARLTNGIITTIGAGLAAAGAVASIVCVVKAGSIVVSAIVITTATSAIVYNISNMLEGTQDIIYGATGEEQGSINPVLSIFNQFIPDEQTASLLYHIWGVGNTIISGLMMPITKALKIAKVRSLNILQTSASVIRASITTIAKVLATGVGASIVDNYVSKVVTKLTKNGSIGKLAGFGACLISGFFLYKGLDAADRHLDISGLYPKPAIKAAFVKSQDEQVQYLIRKETISAQQRGEDEALVNYVVDIATDHYGLESRPNVLLIYDSESSIYGGYNPEVDTLIINMRAEDHQYAHELFDTIGHEMRHAFQYQDIRNNPQSEYADSLINYISPEVNYDAYFTQTCEADAYREGAAFADFMMDYFNTIFELLAAA